MKPTSFIIGLAAAAFLARATAAEEFSTTPVGVTTVSIPGGGATSVIGINLIEKPAYVGRASAVGANTVNVTSADFTQSLTAGRAYALLITGGPNAGVNTPVTDWTSTQLTVSDDLAGLLAPDQDPFQLQVLPTISEIFGTGGEVLAGGAAASADLVIVRDPDGPGELSLFYSTGGLPGVGWRAVGKGASDYANFPIYFTDGMFIKKKSAGAVSFEEAGSVQMNQVAVPVRAGTSALAAVFASGVVLDNSGLHNASAPENSLAGGSSAAADVVLFDSNGDGTLESFYYSTGGLTGVGWRRIGSGADPQGGLAIPSGFGIKKRTGSTELVRTAPY